MGFPGGSDGKKSLQCRRPGLIPRYGRSPGEGNGNPLQYSCLESPVDGGAWWAVSMGSHRVGHDWSDLACMNALEKEIAAQSSILAWRIPGMEESGGLSVSQTWLKRLSSSSTLYFYQENSMDRGAWWATEHGVAKSQTHNWATNTFTVCSTACLIFIIFGIIYTCKCIFGQLMIKAICQDC